MYFSMNEKERRLLMVNPDRIKALCHPEVFKRAIRKYWDTLKVGDSE
ncbi:hypothetical protein LCGC14_1935830 [marine sediment metagenome]|uniref:Uncharacterized protein n=1 Tax=marine sediment metagenome TaxID=412755 RepID=A0A0F9GA49_9ZZZZ